jgi:hypothetical protein
MPNVRFMRNEVRQELPKWTLIRDCVEGQSAIKNAKETYLPRPNKADTSEENQERYNAYIERAVFYNATRRTLDGLVGQVFTRDPKAELPKGLEILLQDVDGGGVVLNQQAKRCLSEVMSYGRAGLLVDFPETVAPASKSDLENGYIRPTVSLYFPWSIINWRTITKGARVLLSLVVLEETYIKKDDGFEVTVGKMWRVLRLVDDVYRIDEYLEEDFETPNRTTIPKDSSGKELSEIPFQFVGAVNNDTELDFPPLFDLAALNVAHYRNSADYEESCFIVGQPTPYLTGLSENWVTGVLKGSVQLGSRSAIPLPEGGNAGLLQVNPNSMPFEAMGHKERQMVALGAKLVQEKSVQRTLGEAQLEEAAESSILSTAAKNVSSAYTAALKLATKFSGDGSDTLIYELNTDFPASRMTPEERAQLMAEWQGGGIAFSEMREALRKCGVAILDDEEAKNEIDSQPVTPQVRVALDPNKVDPGGNKPGQNAKNRPKA